jgi:hypothetical protein
LFALAILCVFGLATAAVASSGTLRIRAKDAVSSRLTHAR